MHRLTRTYLEDLERRKNWNVFACYLISVASSALLIQSNGPSFFGFVPFVLAVAVLAHRQLNRRCKKRLAEAGAVQVEIKDGRFVIRNDCQEQSVLVTRLRSVRHTSEHAPSRSNLKDFPGLLSTAWKGQMCLLQT